VACKNHSYYDRSGPASPTGWTGNRASAGSVHVKDHLCNQTGENWSDRPVLRKNQDKSGLLSHSWTGGHGYHGRKTGGKALKCVKTQRRGFELRTKHSTVDSLPPDYCLWCNKNINATYIIINCSVQRFRLVKPWTEDSNRSISSPVVITMAKTEIFRISPREKVLVFHDKIQWTGHPNSTFLLSSCIQKKLLPWIGWFTSCMIVEMWTIGSF